MTYSLILLAAGVILAWFGGEIFVKGGVGLALWARWPTAVIGVTVAAFGTSSPELLVAIHSAIDGVPQISLGDVLGSNVVNVALVLAIVLALSGMKAGDSGIRRDWWCALAVPGLIYAVLWDGWFSRIDALVLLACFLVWLTVVILHARAHARAYASAEELMEGVEKKAPLSRSIFLSILGLAILIGAAQLVVTGGKGVATALGWSPFIVGAVVVAIATSTPELATTLVSRMRGHDDVGLGNILGSNIFNAMFIAAVAALIHPYPVQLGELRPSLLAGVATVLLILPGRGGHLGQWRGFVLLLIYGIYITMTLAQNQLA
ncbi:cation:H+ antiporter [Prosthecobacter debontii]|uniref:Cation:H+ antiporter n=1 Tax=Prosthecobacter debontii TaxID=48467 RepID=A0A1T4Y9I0_9BACT|nr:calcium/sodium antiporter [Prosthecobacter debontii]SKA98168.1 cation:H+ antiporter [Prosthecobacter debontii]